VSANRQTEKRIAEWLREKERHRREEESAARENNIIQERMDAAIAQYNAGRPYHSPHLEGDNLSPTYDVQEEL